MLDTSRLRRPLLAVVILTLAVLACGRSATPQAAPTPTPYPTYTPHPTHTPSPVPVPPTSATAPAPTALLSSDPREFSIYLLAQHGAAHQVSTLDVLDLEQEPILSVSDIIAYYWETHTIELTASAYERMAELEVPVDGTIFVVCLGREPIYAGAFWPMYSSLSFDGAVIKLPLTDDHTMQITLGYPSPSFFTGEDPRSDPRILQSLERAGKLE